MAIPTFWLCSAYPLIGPQKRTMHSILRLTLLLSCSSFLLADQTPPSPEGIQFFETKIRPVLVEHCYACHSAEAGAKGKLEAELLLDSKQGIRKGGESGPGVVPGDVQASLIVAAIRHESVEMPPQNKLPEAVIADFVRWIEMGAPDPREGEHAVVAKKEIDVAAGKEFWSFQPLSQVAPPQVENMAWVKTPLDRYILAAQEAQGIQPNDSAQRTVLIRRLYFDLWGLPPSRQDVERFVKDPSDDAYEQLVERLLEGEHFGERWARHWLDLARFAESNGYAFDKDRAAAFHYRDFVIRALNENMPYDQFVRLQLAGDLLDPSDYMAQAATGFLAAGPFTSQQTQKERERSRYEQLDDIVGTMGTAMLGMTIGCARCHDHKFDPIGHHDYYRLVASFAETGFQDYAWDPEPEKTKQALDAFNAEHQPFTDARVAYEKDSLPGQFDAWEAEGHDERPAETLGNWFHIGPFTDGDYKKTFDKKFPPESKVDLTKPIGELKWTEHTEWKDETVHNPFNQANAAQFLYREINVVRKGPLDISLGADDGIKVVLNGKQVFQSEAQGGASPDEHKLTLQLKEGKNDLVLKIVNGGGPSGFYFSSLGVVIPDNIQKLLDLANDKRNDKQRGELVRWFAPRDPAWVALDQAEKEHLKKKPVPKLTNIYAARKGGATYNFGADTRKVYFLARGNSNSKNGLASPAPIRVLMRDAKEDLWLKDPKSSDEKPAQRLARIALADWMTDPEHGAGPLLARVIVNRLWQHHFGRGIVATPSDFGSQGAPPTHPKLLDHLAHELIGSGWDLRHVHRLILHSSVYRQSGDTNSDSQQKDPDNLLWWRKSPQRMEAEIIRDMLLVVGGTLDKRMYGAGSLDEKDARRSVYLKVKRSNLIPILQLFDAPDSIQSIGDRGVTTVPPQALAMMNSDFVRKTAEKLAERITKTAGDNDEKLVEEAFWITLSRAPSTTESEQLTQFIRAQAESYGTDPAARNAAISDYCHLMLCLNEFVYVD